MNTEQTLIECHDLADKMEEQIERLLDAKKALGLVNDQAVATLSKQKDHLNEKKAFLEEEIQNLDAVRSYRMAIIQELTFVTTAVDKWNKLFVGPEHRKTIEAMKEFLDLCERYEKLKASADILKGLL